jgi:tetratricopeptide (TPR) repeat protein
VRLLPFIVCLALVACGHSAVEINARGEQHAAAWAKSEDNSDFLQASRAFTEAVNLDPENPVYHYNLGTLFAQARCYEMALPELRRALAIRPSYPEARQNIEFVEEALAAKESKCETSISPY